MLSRRGCEPLPAGRVQLDQRVVKIEGDEVDWSVRRNYSHGAEGSTGSREGSPHGEPSGHLRGIDGLRTLIDRPQSAGAFRAGTPTGDRRPAGATPTKMPLIRCRSSPSCFDV